MLADESNSIYLDGYFFDENATTTINRTICQSYTMNEGDISCSYFMSTMLVINKIGEMVWSKPESVDECQNRVGEIFLSCPNVRITKNTKMFFGTSNANNVEFGVDCPY